MDISTTLKNRIDFCGIIAAEKCNPNGDPINGNAPRRTFDGHGVISDVCIKRKIRDRIHEQGYNIFVLRQEDLHEGQTSLQGLTKADPDLQEALKLKDEKNYKKIACEKWIDVRAFGQVFAFKEKDGNISIAIRGPVSIQDAVSLSYVDVSHKGLTKVVNTNEAEGRYGKAKDTMGFRYQIDHGAYVFRGSIYPQLASLTGFTYEDALLIKKAMILMFLNDATSARPSGSIYLDKLYWWEHNCPSGQYSPVKVFRTLDFTATDTAPFYEAKLTNLPGLEPEINDGW